jgi:hypothetical protein
VDERPGRRLVERADEDVQVLPEAFADLVLVLEAAMEEGHEVGRRDLVAQDLRHFVQRRGQAPPDLHLGLIGELEVVGPQEWPALASGG